MMKMEPPKKLLHDYADQLIYQSTTNMHMMKMEPPKKLLHDYADQSLAWTEERN
jgi:hypothetical protein